MQFYQDTVKIILVILTFAVLGLATFVLYKDNVVMKEDIFNMKQELNDLSEQFDEIFDKSFKNENLMGMMQSDSESDEGAYKDEGKVYDKDEVPDMKVFEIEEDTNEEIEEKIVSEPEKKVKKERKPKKKVVKGSVLKVSPDVDMAPASNFESENILEVD